MLQNSGVGGYGNSDTENPKTRRSDRPARQIHSSAFRNNSYIFKAPRNEYTPPETLTLKKVEIFSVEPGPTMTPWQNGQHSKFAGVDL